MAKGRFSKVERKTVEVEKVKMINLTLRDLLKSNLIKEIEKLEKSSNKQINPIAFIFMSEEKKDGKMKMEPIILSHESKRDYLDKKISVAVNDGKLMEDIIRSLKSV